MKSYGAGQEQIADEEDNPGHIHHFCACETAPIKFFYADNHSHRQSNLINQQINEISWVPNNHPKLPRGSRSL